MFADSLQTVLSHEGYYSNHPNDKGGETYCGIARNFHPQWIGWRMVDDEKARYGGNLGRNHRVDHPLIATYVAQFYKKTFWDKILLDQVNDPQLQTIIFDAYVNSRNSGIKLLQRTLNEKFGKTLKVDGICGPNTIAAVNSVNAEQLFDAYHVARTKYYVSIAKGSNAVFLPGWLNRINSFNYKVVGLSLAGVAVIGVAGFFL